MIDYKTRIFPLKHRERRMQTPIDGGQPSLPSLEDSLKQPGPLRYGPTMNVRSIEGFLVTTYITPTKDPIVDITWGLMSENIRLQEKIKNLEILLEKGKV